MVPEVPKWSPDLLQLCSRSVSGCTRGTLGPSFGIRTWFRVPSWAPRTTLGAKFGVENLFFRYPPVNFRRKNQPEAIRFTMFRFSMSLVRRIVRGISSHMVNKVLFFSLGPKFGIRPWFRVPPWTPRTMLGATLGVGNFAFGTR